MSEIILRAAVEELAEAFAAIPDDHLIEAYQAEWLDRGLEPPPLSAEELREACWAGIEQFLARAPRERLLTITEAAYHLETTERSLRHQVDQGLFDDALTQLPDGRRALRFHAPTQGWPLCLPKPDPRILWLMKAEDCRPGERHRLGYRRLQRGDNWRRA